VWRHNRARARDLARWWPESSTATGWGGPMRGWRRRSRGSCQPRWRRRPWELRDGARVRGGHEAPQRGELEDAMKLHDGGELEEAIEAPRRGRAPAPPPHGHHLLAASPRLRPHLLPRGGDLHIGGRNRLENTSPHTRWSSRCPAKQLKKFLRRHSYGGTAGDAPSFLF
jgi:hypothetical protein